MTHKLFADLLRDAQERGDVEGYQLLLDYGLIDDSHVDIELPDITLINLRDATDLFIKDPTTVRNAPAATIELVNAAFANIFRKDVKS